jgi:hypothetical protein
MDANVKSLVSAMMEFFNHAKIGHSIIRLGIMLNNNNNTSDEKISYN